jgi:hypothetical protein
MYTFPESLVAKDLLEDRCSVFFVRQRCDFRMLEMSGMVQPREIDYTNTAMESTR